MTFSHGEFSSDKETGPPERPETAISPEARAVLAHVYINMPWNYLDRFRGLVLDNGINIEIGFAAEILDKTPVAEIAGVVETFRSKGCRITVHGPFWDLCTGSIDPEIRKVSRSRLGQLFEVIERILPDRVVCHTGFDPRHHRSHREAWIQNSLAGWEPLVKAAERLQVPLLVENVWEEDPGLHVKLFETIDSPWFGFCLDTGHQNAFSKTPLNAWLDATARFLKEIHLHDNDGSFDFHLPIGDGNIDFDFLFAFLRQREVHPVLTLEPHKEEHLYRSLQRLAQMDSFRAMLERK